MNFTERVQRVEPSATLAISDLASELEADGVDVVDLSVGEPDFSTPEPIVQAAKEALDAGHTGYAPSNGIPELKAAITESLTERGLSYTEDNIIVTPGGKQALFEVVQSLVEEGSEVVLLDPAWVSYEAMDSRKANLTYGSIAVGVEYRVGKTRPVQGVFGGGVNYAFGQRTYRFNYGNAITEMNQTPTISAD